MSYYFDNLLPVICDFFSLTNCDFTTTEVLVFDAGLQEKTLGLRRAVYCCKSISNIVWALEHNRQKL